MGRIPKVLHLTPLLNPTTQEERNYNTAYISTRNTVESQYGIWKRRFPILKLGIRTTIQTAMNIIVAIAVLHNIALDAGDVDSPDDVILQDSINNRRLQQHDDVPVPAIIQEQGIGAYATRAAIISNQITQ